MGQGTDDLNEHERPEVLEREIEDIRDDMGLIAGELDRRRHAVFDWRSQLKNHAGALSLLALGLVLVAAGTTALSVRRKRRRNRPLAKARRLREALSRIIEHPELVAQPRPSIGNKAIAAAVSAAAGSFAKAAAERAAPALLPGR
jgi:hypothetical protein